MKTTPATFARPERLVEANEDFAFESTLSGLHYARRIEACKNRGYSIRIIYIRLPSTARNPVQAAKGCRWRRRVKFGHAVRTRPTDSVPSSRPRRDQFAPHQSDRRCPQWASAFEP